MVAAAAIGAVTTAVGAGVQISQGKKAAKAQRQAAQQASDTELQMFNQNREDLKPFRETGYKALGTLSSMYGANPNGKTLDMSQQVMKTPGYKFRLSEGVKAVERSAAARGLLGSGATMKAVQRYGEGLAASEYDSYANRLAALAGVGQTATNTTAQLGANTASNVAGNQIAAGNARASSYANTGSAINGAINNGLSAYLYAQGGGFGSVMGGGGGRFGGGEISITPMNKRFY